MRFAVLLRGVNVGGRTIKMADLKKCLETGGFANVVTLQAAGNVLLDASGTPKAVGAAIEKLLRERFDYDAQVLAYKVTDLARIVEANPYRDVGADAHAYVIFAEPHAAKELLALGKEVDEAIERVAEGPGCVYWTVPKGSTLQSDFAKRMAKAKLVERTTTRNMNTVKKLVAAG